MNRTIFGFLFLFLSLQSFAQEKVNWSCEYNSMSDHLELKAVIAEGWHLYSQHINNDIGPIPTAFEFKENPNVKFIGKMNEPESIKEYDKNFEGDLNFFKDEVVFTQKVKVNEPTEIVGTITYMVCNEVMCMPPRDEIIRITIDK